MRFPERDATACLPKLISAQARINGPHGTRPKDRRMTAQDTSADNSATLLIRNRQTQMPVGSGTIGPDVIDVGRLYRDTGCFT